MLICSIHLSFPVAVRRERNGSNRIHSLRSQEKESPVCPCWIKKEINECQKDIIEHWLILLQGRIFWNWIMYPFLISPEE